MQAGFLSKLYEIKPFKIVNSPQSCKNTSLKQVQGMALQPNSAKKRLMHLQSPISGKQNARQFVKISESSVFTNLSTSIDHLFSKIQKIKEQFDYQEPSSIQRAKQSHTKRSAKQQSNQQKSSYKKPAYRIQQPICSAFDSSQPSGGIDKKLSSQTCDSVSNQPTRNVYQKVSNHTQNSVQNFYSNIPTRISVNMENSHQQQGFHLSMRQFELGRCVGSGKFGDVHLCKHKATSTIFALKKIFKSTIRQYNMVEQFLKQLKIHFILNHPNITKLYTVFEDDYHVFLLMEYAKDGTLYDKFLQKNIKTEQISRQKRQEEVSQAIFQVLNAVQYLHRKNVVHRDIKPENIVISNNTAKLCDFGWSAVFDCEMKKTFCGTLDYLSPEMKDKGEYTTSVDLWSIGVLTFQLMTGYAPFKNEIQKMKWKPNNKEQKSLRSNKWKWDDIIFPPEISESAKDFIQGLLKENPDDRISLRQCLRHSFIIQYNEGRDRQVELSRDAALLF